MITVGEQPDLIPFLMWYLVVGHPVADLLSVACRIDHNIIAGLPGPKYRSVCDYTIIKIFRIGIIQRSELIDKAAFGPERGRTLPGLCTLCPHDHASVFPDSCKAIGERSLSPGLAGKKILYRRDVGPPDIFGTAGSSDQTLLDQTRDQIWLFLCGFCIQDPLSFFLLYI